MRQRFLNLLDRLIGVGCPDTSFDSYLLQVRYRALQRQIPSLYLIALTSVVGWHVASGISTETLIHPANLLVLLVVFRIWHWLKTRNRKLSSPEIVRQLRITFGLSALLSATASFWTIQLLAEGAPQQQDLIILFASLASIGCAYGLSSFASAGRLPLILFALPFSVVLCMSPNAAHGAVGISLAIIAMLTLRLLDMHNRGIAEIVHSRVSVDAERDRALRAEQAAIIEQEKAREVANTDSLTGLPNRRAFINLLADRLRRPGRFSVMLVDLDSFKPINDVFGHAAGDAVLIEVAERLRRSCGAEHFVARMGGDEFAALIELAEPQRVYSQAKLMTGDIGRPVAIDGRNFEVSASAGLMIAEPEKDDVLSALRHADAALYAGKERGNRKIALFNRRLERATERRVRIELELRKPAMLQQLRLVYQPIFDLRNGQLFGFEALARWQHPRMGEIPPSEFIPIAEQIARIEQISDALLGQTVIDGRDWSAGLTLSFNLSAVQIGSAGAAQRILSVLNEGGVAPSKMLFEVTETALLPNFEQARRNLSELRQAGARIALDDFGAGYASIAYLREMHFDVLKLDGSLVCSLENPHSQRLLSGIVELCRSLDLSCLAEHVATDTDIRLVTEVGCTYAQGYGLAEPVEADVALGLARSNMMRIGLAPRRPRLVTAHSRSRVMSAFRHIVDPPPSAVS